MTYSICNKRLSLYPLREIFSMTDMHWPWTIVFEDLLPGSAHTSLLDMIYSQQGFKSRHPTQTPNLLVAVSRGRRTGLGLRLVCGRREPPDGS